MDGHASAPRSAPDTPLVGTPTTAAEWAVLPELALARTYPAVAEWISHLSPFHPPPAAEAATAAMHLIPPALRAAACSDLEIRTSAVLPVPSPPPPQATASSTDVAGGDALAASTAVAAAATAAAAEAAIKEPPPFWEVGERDDGGAPGTRSLLLSTLYVPIAVDGSVVLGWAVCDTLLDRLSPRSRGTTFFPRLSRWAMDTTTGEMLTVTTRDDGRAVQFAAVGVDPDRGGLTMLSSTWQRAEGLSMGGRDANHGGTCTAAIPAGKALTGDASNSSGSTGSGSGFGRTSGNGRGSGSGSGSGSLTLYGGFLPPTSFLLDRTSYLMIRTGSFPRLRGSPLDIFRAAMELESTFGCGASQLGGDPRAASGGAPPGGVAMMVSRRERSSWSVLHRLSAIALTVGGGRVSPTRLCLPPFAGGPAARMAARSGGAGGDGSGGRADDGSSGRDSGGSKEGANPVFPALPRTRRKARRRPRVDLAAVDNPVAAARIVRNRAAAAVANARRRAARLAAQAAEDAAEAEAASASASAALATRAVCASGGWDAAGAAVAATTEPAHPPGAS